MPDIAADMIPAQRPTAERPLLGQTVLVVEDSRFACEAVRLLCLRSGARIRRADSLSAAARHLAVYRPSIALIDLGLPDGSGLSLIRDLDRAGPRVPVILGSSGDDTLREKALAAGADEFLGKPLTSLAVFQSTILAALPPEARPSGPRAVPDGAVAPDPIAFRDDLLHAAELLSAGPDGEALDYAAQFLCGVARSASDAALGEAAARLKLSRTTGQGIDAATARLSAVIGERLSVSPVV